MRNFDSAKKLVGAVIVPVRNNNIIIIYYVCFRMADMV